ncbi:plasmid IncI1-type surface exclusion protein ExcA [Pseudomonas amygdali pv. morsprunorum]|uniref:Plasmid IncI1-type surface exclusion protein ExcA n=1 Tax=Pseudomonas amygdali pv. morsprunorum TaxID=129138 RepID=A0AB35R7Y3_PSEA0|nr:plasmid IncI1-type surface exclusion protein ExcA [Pseudomonas amygdali]MDT3244150.1 plasmid IncI1-type surface exclusion protein ExcA [Pseudomonas amygdali pv. morsprunorum]
MKVQRFKTAKEGWLVVFKGLYLIAFPFLLIFAILFLIAAIGSMPGKFGREALVVSGMIWTPILISLFIFFRGVFSRRSLLKRVTAELIEPQLFNPDAANEMYHEGDGKYLGIDTQNGTILYVHRIRKGQVDVVGLTMDDWTNREVEGNMFRLYTKFPDLPRIEIATPLAQRWYDTLGAMEHKQKQYSTPQPFNRYVHDRLETLERDLNVQIPRLA